MDIIRTNATIAILATFALAGSGTAARAQHLGGESLERVTPSGIVALKGSVAGRGAKGDRDFDHRGRLLLPGFVSDFGTPYWSDYNRSFGAGHAFSYDYGYSQGQTRLAPEYLPRWDNNNHSPTLEMRWPVTGQPSAAVTAIPSHDNDERDRAWFKRCEPRLAFDDNGVQRYSYNGKRGCSSGQWDE